MTDGSFQEAYARVRSRYSDEAWLALNPRQITEAIYGEMRLIDAERMQKAQSQEDAIPGQEVCLRHLPAERPQRRSCHVDFGVIITPVAFTNASRKRDIFA